MLNVAYRQQVRRSNARLLSSTCIRLSETDGPAITPTNRAQATMKRFWKTVDIAEKGDHLTVTLDKRGLKTPGGKSLLIPKSKRLVATLIANEWENQETLLKPHALPMTSLTSRAIDDLSDPEVRPGVCELLMKYLDTDTICYQETRPPALVRLQAEHWDPLLNWVRSEYGVEVKVIDSYFGYGQAPETRAKLQKVVEEMDQWELAAFERAVYSTKSFIVALATVKGRLNAEEASLASQVEVASQIETWGEVEDSHDVDYRDIRRQMGSVKSLL